MAAMFAILVYGIPLLLIFLYARWGYRDGECRGKEGWLVALLVLTGPVGLLAWLALRPEQVSFAPPRSRPIVGPGTDYDVEAGRSRVVDVAREKGSLLR